MQNGPAAALHHRNQKPNVKRAGWGGADGPVKDVKSHQMLLTMTGLKWRWRWGGDGQGQPAACDFVF